MGKRTKYVKIRKVDFLKAVKENYEKKSFTYLSFLYSALALILDREGTSEGMQRTIDNMSKEDFLYLPQEDLL